MPHSCRVLVLAPTRELASQIQQSFAAYGRNLRLTSTVVFGGVDMRRQERIMARGVDILVATPGRLVDHMNHRTIRLDRVEVVVLDEVDRMLDIGFIHAIRRVMSHVPTKRQSLFFSATLPKDIAALAAELLKDPATVKVVPVATTAERVEQRVVHVDQAAEEGRAGQAAGRRRGDPGDRVHPHQASRRPGDAPSRGRPACRPRPSTATSRRTSASARSAASRTARTRVLVATDIAARGIDVDGVSHVVNFDLPEVRRDLRPPDRPHRPRRRRGPGDRVLRPAERGNWRAIETLIRQRVPVIEVEGSRATGAERAAHQRAEAYEPAPRNGRGGAARRAATAAASAATRAPPRRPATAARPPAPVPAAAPTPARKAAAAPAEAGFDLRPVPIDRPQLRPTRQT